MKKDVIIIDDPPNETRTPSSMQEQMKRWYDACVPTLAKPPKVVFEDRHGKPYAEADLTNVSLDKFISDALKNPAGSHQGVFTDTASVEVHSQRDGKTLVRGHLGGVDAEILTDGLVTGIELTRKDK